MSTGSSALTVVWANDRPLAAAIEEHRGTEGLSVCSVGPDRLEVTVFRAAFDGAVVVIVGGSEDEERALRYGADEVLRADAIDSMAVERALRAARARATARGRRESALVDRLRVEEQAAAELFAGAIGCRAEQALDRAGLGCEALEQALGFCLGGTPALDGLDGQLDDISGSIREAARLFRQMRAMLASERDDPTDLRLVVWQLGVLMRPAVERSARFVLDVLDRPCFVDVPRWQLVHAIGALVHESIRRAAACRVRPRIHLEMYLQDDDIAVLEVKDDVSYPQGDALSFVTSRLGSDQGAIGLSVLGARVRQIGGELLVDTHPERGTAVRVFFPLAETPRRLGARRLRSVS